MTTSERTFIAFHEAAHAVAACRNGEQCGGTATIVPRGDTAGHARSDGWEFAPDDARRNVVVGLLVGYAAEVKMGQGEQLALAHASSDIEKAAEVMVALGETDEAAWRERARAFVEVNWSAIKRVAAELLERGTVDGQLVDLLIDVADGVLTEEGLARARLLMAADEAGR